MSKDLLRNACFLFLSYLFNACMLSKKKESRLHCDSFFFAPVFHRYGLHQKHTFMLTANKALGMQVMSKTNDFRKQSRGEIRGGWGDLIVVRVRFLYHASKYVLRPVLLKNILLQDCRHKTLWPKIRRAKIRSYPVKLPNGTPFNDPGKQSMSEVTQKRLSLSFTSPQTFGVCVLCTPCALVVQRRQQSPLS